jgi:hypothetical protein
MSEKNCIPSWAALVAYSVEHLTMEHKIKMAETKLTKLCDKLECFSNWQHIPYFIEYSAHTSIVRT